MDALRQRKLDDFDGYLRELLRRVALVRVLVKPKIEQLPGSWVGLFDACVSDMFVALRDAENEVLEQQRKRRVKRRSAKSQPQKRRVNKGIHKFVIDPSTIPGAIRVALTNHPDGLKMPELIQKVLTLRPETSEGSIPSSLHPMVKRGEVSREGFHRSYRYILIGRDESKSNGALKKEASITK